MNVGQKLSLKSWSAVVTILAISSFTAINISLLNRWAERELKIHRLFTSINQHLTAINSLTWKTLVKENVDLTTRQEMYRLQQAIAKLDNLQQQKYLQQTELNKILQLLSLYENRIQLVFSLVDARQIDKAHQTIERKDIENLESDLSELLKHLDKVHFNRANKVKKITNISTLLFLILFSYFHFSNLSVFDIVVT